MDRRGPRLGTNMIASHRIRSFLHVLAITAIFPWIVVGCSGADDTPKAPVVESADSFRQALDSINALIVQSPKSAALYDYRSQLYLAVDSLPAATLDLERALRLDSTNVNRQLRMGDLYYRREAVVKAKERFETAAKLDPKSTQAKLKLAEIDLLLRNYRESMNLVNDALRIDQHAAHGYYLKGWIHMETGDTALALSSFATAVEQDPQDYPVYIMLGKLSAAKHDPLAVQYYRTAITIRPRSVEAWYDLGMYHQDHGQDSLALDCYSHIMEIDSANAIAWYNTGYVQLVHQHEWQTAKTSFSRAISLEPGYVDAWYNRGLAMEKLDQLDSAAANYQMVLSMREDYPMASAALDRLGSKGVRIKMREGKKAQ